MTHHSHDPVQNHAILIITQSVLSKLDQELIGWLCFAIVDVI